MKITKIEIDNFGKYKNFTLDLNDGLNVILGQNEAGKSTLCAFLYAMFYGLPNESKKLGIREDARKRYLPWDGESMAGSIHFIHNGRPYVLSRKFAKTRRGDKFSLKDGTSWEDISNISPDDIGSTFLSVGEDGFLKTLFISQLGAAISPDSDDEVLKKLSNLGQSGAEDISYQAAADAISKARHEIISKSERAGILPRLEQEKAELEYELAESIRVSKLFREDIILQNRLKQENDRLTNELSELETQKALAKEHLHLLETEKTNAEHNRLAERKTENEFRISELQKQLELYNEQIKKYNFAENITQTELIELAQTENDVNTIKDELKDINDLKERLAELKEQLKDKKTKQKSGINIPMLIIALAVSVLGIVLGVTLSLILLTLLPVGILLGIISFVGKFGLKAQKEEVLELENEIELLEKETSEERVKEINSRLIEKQKALNDILCIASVDNVHQLAQIIADKNQLVQNITASQKELSLLLQTQEQINEDLKRIPTETATTFSDDAREYKGKSLEELDALLSENHTNQLKNQREYENVRYRVEEASSGVKSTDVILTELAEIEEKIEQYRFYYDALNMAQNALFNSYSEIKQGFAPVLNEYAGEIVSILTDGKYSELRVSDDYKIMLKENKNGEIVSAEYLSGGTYDILYFALRLGIAKVIFDDKIPLLVLDDTFLQMDDKRAALTANYLKANCDAEQIIYFTCHESQADLFGNNNRIILN